MGCNCGGSLRREQLAQHTSRQQVRREQQATRQRRSGGLGEEGYAWTGPKTPAPTQAR